MIRIYILLLLLLILLLIGGRIKAQTMYGTTGLLHAPTAEMQKDKTILIGGSMIDHNIYRSGYWNSHKEYNPYTYNYYLNITFFSMAGSGIHLYVSKRRSRLAATDFR